MVLRVDVCLGFQQRLDDCLEAEPGSNLQRTDALVAALVRVGLGFQQPGNHFGLVRRVVHAGVEEQRPAAVVVHRHAQACLVVSCQIVQSTGLNSTHQAVDHSVCRLVHAGVHAGVVVVVGCWWWCRR